MFLDTAPQSFPRLPLTDLPQRRSVDSCLPRQLMGHQNVHAIGAMPSGLTQQGGRHSPDPFDFRVMGPRLYTFEDGGRGVGERSSLGVALSSLPGR